VWWGWAVRDHLIIFAVCAVVPLLTTLTGDENGDALPLLMGSALALLFAETRRQWLELVALLAEREDRGSR